MAKKKWVKAKPGAKKAEAAEKAPMKPAGGKMQRLYDRSK